MREAKKLERYNLVIVSAPNHFEMVKRNKELYFKYLPICKIIVIGNISGENFFKDDSRIEVLDEDKLYPQLNKVSVRHLVEAQGGHMTRSNWYFQQFLKMAYAYKCNSEYYIVWDADTVPVRPISLFEDGKPQFSYCEEFREDYFVTLDKLFHGKISKQNENSFIVEHMVIKTEFMKELIHEIESDPTLNGTFFFEKIISVISPEAIKVAGFSEFETYANYILTKHRESYGIRQLKAFRYGLVLTGYKLNSNMVSWLGNSRDTVSFEHFCRPSIWRFLWLNTKIYNSKSVDEIWEWYQGSSYQRVDNIINTILNKKDRIIYLISRVPDKFKKLINKLIKINRKG